jgi:hypothetical protein
MFCYEWKNEMYIHKFTFPRLEIDRDYIVQWAKMYKNG